MNYAQARPLVNKLMDIAVLYHACPGMLREKIYAAIDEFMPTLDESCLERGCPAVDQFSAEPNAKSEQEQGMNTPFICVGADDLTESTETIHCGKCGKDHPIEYGTSKTLLPDNTWTQPVKSKVAGFYKCGDKLYLGTLDGRRVR